MDPFPSLGQVAFNGEKRVFNLYYNEQEIKTLRKGEASRLDKTMGKQDLRDQAREQVKWEKRKRYERYRGKKRKEENVTKRKPRQKKKKANYSECATLSRRDLDYSGCSYHRRGFRSMRQRSITSWPKK